MFTNPSTARARFAEDGRLLALVADAPDAPAEETPGPLDFLSVEEGQPAPTREAVQAALADADRATLQAIIDAAVAEGQAIAADEAPITGEVLARINLLADAREVAEARVVEIDTEEQQVQADAAAALARLAPPAAEEEPPAEETPAGDEAPAAERTPEPVTASAPRRRTTALPRPGSGSMPSTTGRGNADTPTGPAAYTAPRATATLTASAAVPEGQGVSPGMTIETREHLGQAMINRLRTLRNVQGGDGENVPVASLAVSYPEERRLGQDVGTNARRIREATSREVLVASAAAARAERPETVVAAGGLCAPIAVDLAVPVVGTPARPIRDALTGFGVEGSGGGGVKWRENLSFADFAGATSVWTMENDAAVGTAQQVAKPCLDIVCPDDAEAYVEALTMCMTFSNVTARFDPEMVAANVEAAQIAHARFAENRLLAQIGALSTTVTAPSEVSAIRDYLVALDKLLAAFRSFFRIDDTVALHSLAPRWMRDAIRTDLTRGAGMSGGLEMLSVTDAQINAWLGTRNVNPTWHLDGLPGTTAGVGEVAMADQFYGALVDNAPLPDFPAQVETLIWVEGEMLHLDGGQLDLGVVRDSALNQVNRYKQFSETFEGVAHRGVQAVRMVMDLSPSGMVAGTKDTEAIIAS